MRCWRMGRLMKNEGEVCCQFSCGAVSPRDDVAVGRESFMPRMRTTGATLVLRLLAEASREDQRALLCWGLKKAHDRSFGPV